MKNPINKSNLRQPLRGILLLTLLLVVSNTFISSVTQFLIVNKEISTIGSYYKSIGTIQPFDREQYYINEAQKIITGDQMIDYEDNRRVSQGIIDGLYNTDIRQYENSDSEFADYMNDDYKIFLGNFVFTAVVDAVHKSRSAETIYDGIAIYITSKEQLAGFPDYYIEEGHNAVVALSNSFKTGEKIEFINNDVIDDLLTLEVGKTYLFRTYYDVSTLNEYSFIKPLYTNGPLYEKLDDDGYIDWGDPKWSMLKEDIEVLNENIQSYGITATKDMTTIPIFQESMKQYYLKEGRLINQEDHINQNHVCVINEHLSRIRNINIGDKLEIQMRNTEKGDSYLTSAKDRRDWKTYKTSEPISFEVVGISGAREYYRTSFGRNIYIPESTLPDEFGHYYNQGMEEPDMDSFYYSFTLKSSEDQSTFIEKYEEPLKKLGYKLYFLENNAESFWDSVKPIKDSAMISFVLFTILLLLTQIYIVYIYIEGHKLNYAIERALGISRRVSGTHMILPFIIYGAIASIGGGFLGYSNAIDKAGELLANLSKLSQISINPSLDMKYFFIFILGVIMVFIIILLIRMKQLKSISIIDLINNHSGKKYKRKQNFTEEVYKMELEKINLNKSALDFTEFNKVHINEDLGTNSGRDTLRRYSINHSLRSKISSIILIILAGIFVFSLLWMNFLIIKNNEFINNAYKETIVTGGIITEDDRTIIGTQKGPISGTHIDNFINTDLVKDYTTMAHMLYKDMYIEKDGVETKYEMSEEDKKAIHIPEASFEVRASNKPYNIDGNVKLKDLYLIDGYSIDDFYKEYKVDDTNKAYETIPILVSEKAMKDYELELGGKIALVPEFREVIKTFGTIVGSFSELDMTQIAKWYEYYTTISSEEQSLFIYPLSVLESMEKSKIHYDRLEFEFKPEANRELLARKDELKTMVSDNKSDDYRNELKLWDGELINVVDPLEKNLSLLKVLYPITFIVSILIAGILGFMMVLRRTLDVAILRILGVKEKEVKKSLFMENIILTLIGISIGVITMLLITLNSYSIPLVKYAMVIGGYLLGIIAGLILSIRKVTHKKPLEMLQVKE